MFVGQCHQPPRLFFALLLRLHVARLRNSAFSTHPRLLSALLSNASGRSRSRSTTIPSDSHVRMRSPNKNRLVHPMNRFLRSGLPLLHLQHANHLSRIDHWCHIFGSEFHLEGAPKQRSWLALRLVFVFVLISEHVLRAASRVLRRHNRCC